MLLGEYASDVLNGRQLMLCKKNDSIMLFSHLNGPESLYLAPKDFGGLVILVNTGPPEYINCKCLRTVIDGRMRVILYTSRVIKKGEELLYQYG